MEVLCFGTFINMWINVKGLIPRINAAVSVKVLTERQRSELAVNPLVRKITHSQVLKTDVLGGKNTVKNFKLLFCHEIPQMTSSSSISHASTWSLPCSQHGGCDHTHLPLCKVHRVQAVDLCILWGTDVWRPSGCLLWRWPPFRCSGQKTLTGRGKKGGQLFIYRDKWISAVCTHS